MYLNMRLIPDQHRLDIRSTAEMTVDQLALLRLPLGTSEVIRDYEDENRPRRGGVIFGFVPLLMTYILMECRKTTYRGIVKNLSDHDCACLGLPVGKDGKFMRPSAGTLNGFVNNRLSKVADQLVTELAKAVLESIPGSMIITLDSTPMQASSWNRDAEYNPHYGMRMDKAHIVMVNGHPLFMFRSSGTAGDNPFAAPLIELFHSVNPGGRKCSLCADGAYYCFETYALVYMRTGAVMACNLPEGAVSSGLEEEDIRKAYCDLWKADGYDPHRKNDTDFMLRFLFRNGRAELAGMYIRDLAMSGEKRGENPRHVCETVRRAMKRWVDFDIFRIRKATKELRVKCRFLCVGLLSALFRGYT